MSIATRLRLALGLYLALLLGVLVMHTAAVSASAERVGRVRAAAGLLDGITASSRAREEVVAAAARFTITRDSAYLTRHRELAAGEAELVGQWRAGTTGSRERELLAALEGRWHQLAKGAPGDSLPFILAQVRALSDGLQRSAQQTLDRESQSAVTAARRARWWAVTLIAFATALSTLLALFVARSIIAPVHRVAAAARDVAQGRFSARLHPAPGRHDELSRLEQDFDGMAERLERLDRVKKEFVSNVSHDLKAPLASMQETTGVLLEGLAGPVTTQQRRLLELSHDSGRRLSAMIGDLLTLAHQEGAAPKHQLVDLVDIARVVTTEWSGPREQRGQRFVFVEPETPLFVRGDARGIARVLANLLENASRFAPPDGLVTVRVVAHGGHALLEVADDGPGIPEQERELVFERFHRAPAGRAAATSGMGLGLAICREIVLAHGGRIWVREHSPRGAVFCVLLACASEASHLRGSSPNGSTSRWSGHQRVAGGS